MIFSVAKKYLGKGVSPEVSVEMNLNSFTASRGSHLQIGIISPIVVCRNMVRGPRAPKVSTATGPSIGLSGSQRYSGDLTSCGALLVGGHTKSPLEKGPPYVWHPRYGWGRGYHQCTRKVSHCQSRLLSPLGLVPLARAEKGNMSRSGQALWCQWEQNGVEGGQWYNRRTIYNSGYTIAKKENLRTDWNCVGHKTFSSELNWNPKFWLNIPKEFH